MKRESRGHRTDRTEKWVNSSIVNKPSAPARDYEDDANSNPPNYDQSVSLQYRATQNRSQMQFNPQFGQEMHQTMAPTNNAWPHTGPTDCQMQSLETGNVISREESEEEKRKQMKRALVRRNIPQA